MSKRSVSIRGELYERLKKTVGRRKGRISRTVDKLINDYIDKQEQTDAERN